MIPVWLYTLLALELSLVAYLDFQTKKIRNYWPLLNFALWIISCLLLPQSYPVQWAILFYPLGFLVGGFLLFLVGIMGAGDAKFLFSFFFLVPLKWQAEALTLLLLSTVIVAVSLMMINLLRRYREIVSAVKTGYINGIRQCFGSRFSYAPVILMAWIWLGWKKGIF